MLPLILLAIAGGGYYFYSKKPIQSQSVFHNAVANLPPPNPQVYHTDPGYNAPHGGEPLVPGYTAPPDHAPTSGNPLSTGYHPITYIPTYDERPGMIPSHKFVRGNILTVQSPINADNISVSNPNYSGYKFDQ